MVTRKENLPFDREQNKIEEDREDKIWVRDVLRTRFLTSERRLFSWRGLSRSLGRVQNRGGFQTGLWIFRVVVSNF